MQSTSLEGNPAENRFASEKTQRSTNLQLRLNPRLFRQSGSSPRPMASESQTICKLLPRPPPPAPAAPFLITLVRPVYDMRSPQLQKEQVEEAASGPHGSAAAEITAELGACQVFFSESRKRVNSNLLQGQPTRPGLPSKQEHPLSGFALGLPD